MVYNQSSRKMDAELTAQTTDAKKKIGKNFKKLFETHLTNGEKGGIIIKRSGKGGTDTAEKRAMRGEGKEV